MSETHLDLCPVSGSDCLGRNMWANFLGIPFHPLTTWESEILSVKYVSVYTITHHKFHPPLWSFHNMLQWGVLQLNHTLPWQNTHIFIFNLLAAHSALGFCDGGDRIVYPQSQFLCQTQLGTHGTAKPWQQRGVFKHILKFSIFLVFEIWLNDLTTAVVSTQFGLLHLFFKLKIVIFMDKVW